LNALKQVKYPHYAISHQQVTELLTNNKSPNVALSFNNDGSPLSEQFNDIYFDSESGFQQSEEIFIYGNDIPHRIRAYSGALTIAETGFGTGLNLLLTLQAYQQALLDHEKNSTEDTLATIHFISVEKYPLSKAQLIQSLVVLPQLAHFAEQLIEQYPDDELRAKDHADINASFFNGKVTLTIIIDDAAAGLSQLNDKRTGIVDAWYLDGFSPAKNPEMWSEQLFTQIGRLSKPQATIATFTVAGFVKRHMQRVGFRVSKKACSGNKQAILAGIFQQSGSRVNGFLRRPTITKPQHVSIVGGGIASACAAYALTKKGIKVTLYCKDTTLAQGGSSNAIGALYPLLHQRVDDISLFYQQAFWRARSFYDQILAEGFTFPHQWCGLLEIGYKEALVQRQQKFAELASWPKELIQLIDAKQASNIAKIPLKNGGLFMPNAGWIAPQLAVKQIISAAKATNRLQVVCDANVSAIKQNTDDPSSSWVLSTNKGEFTASVLVICGGAEAIHMDQFKQLPFSSVQGQVSSMKTNDNITDLATVICHKGYLTPQQNYMHSIGATFNKDSFSTQATPEGDAYNLTMLETCLPDISARVKWTNQDIVTSKARLRCMTPDHLPMVGPMPDINAHRQSYPHLAKDKNWQYQQPAPVIDNLYIMMGFGARGLCSAPLAADILAADLCASPYPVDDAMLFNLSPNRFVIRDIIKRK